MTAYSFFSAGPCIIHCTGDKALGNKAGYREQGCYLQKSDLIIYSLCANHLKTVPAEVQWVPNNSCTSNANSPMS